MTGGWPGSRARLRSVRIHGSSLTVEQEMGRLQRDGLPGVFWRIPDIP